MIVMLVAADRAWIHQVLTEAGCRDRLFSYFDYKDRPTTLAEIAARGYGAVSSRERVSARETDRRLALARRLADYEAG